MTKIETLKKLSDNTKKLETHLFNEIKKAVSQFLDDHNFKYESLRGYLTSTTLKIEIVVSETSYATFSETLIYDRPLNRYSIVSDELQELKPFENELSDMINFEFNRSM